MDEEKEQDITAEEKLKQLNEKRKDLKKQILDERELRLKQAAEMREKRDEEIEKIQVKVNKILSLIYAYNKLGKVAKMSCNILEGISKEIVEGYTEEDFKRDQLDASERFN